MGLFNRKDWNIVAIIYERQGMFQVNGQRVKGSAAEKARDGAKAHPRTIFWAVFDQKGSFLEGAAGTGSRNVTPETLKRLERELPLNRVVRDVLKALETAQTDKLAKPLPWAEPASKA